MCYLPSTFSFGSHLANIPAQVSQKQVLWPMHALPVKDLVFALHHDVIKFTLIIHPTLDSFRHFDEHCHDASSHRRLNTWSA